MRTIGLISLSGGQGKTTSAWLLGKRLSNQGKRVILVDCDPQANLTFYAGVEVSTSDATLLEVIGGTINASDAVTSTKHDCLDIIPADNGLERAKEYLASSGMAALLLRKKLSDLAEYDFAILDSPPQRSQMAIAVAGASDFLVIPAEATVKGCNSLVRSLEMLNELDGLEALRGQVLGVIPFRDRWIGINQTKDSRKAVEMMRSVAEENETTVLASILESQRYKEAVAQGTTLKALGYENLEKPFEDVEGLINV